MEAVEGSLAVGMRVMCVDQAGALLTLRALFEKRVGNNLVPHPPRRRRAVPSSSRPPRRRIAIGFVVAEDGTRTRARQDGNQRA